MIVLHYSGPLLQVIYLTETLSSCMISYFFTPLLHPTVCNFFLHRHQACRVLEQNLSDEKKGEQRRTEPHVPKQRAKFTANQILRKRCRVFTPPLVEQQNDHHSAQDFIWSCWLNWDNSSARLVVSRHPGITQLPTCSKVG